MDDLLLTLAERREVLEKASPEGFNWNNSSQTEMAQHEVLLKAQISKVLKEVEAKTKEAKKQERERKMKIAKLIEKWIISQYPIGTETFSDLADQIKEFLPEWAEDNGYVKLADIVADIENSSYPMNTNMRGISLSGDDWESIISRHSKQAGGK